MEKVRWGVLGAAKIARIKVIPAMQKGDWSAVTAIASRDLAKAEAVAKQWNLPKAYGSYEELLADPEIDAVYNPLPNHLHMPWSIKAVEAGKHVLCEKPLSLNAEEVKPLIAARDRAKVKVGEAFMVRTHPQWLRVRQLVREGHIGELKTIFCHFGYNDRDGTNVRYRPEWGGGALMDVGCYPITISRFIFGEEPKKVCGLIENDPEFQTDRLTSAMLDFPSGQAVFTCAMQLNYLQRMIFVGTKARIEVLTPFNAPNNRPTRIVIDDSRDMFGGGAVVEEIPTCDQYTIQGDVFSRAIREDGDVPVPLEDAMQNMAVVDAIFRSVKTGCWEKLVA